MAYSFDKIVVANGNVLLIEPNSVNINTGRESGIPFINGIPQYQDMYIFAELTAESKGRSVIINGKGSNTTSKPINLMGNNQDNSTDNPNYLNFTTNYYDGSTGTRMQYEGFGISNIKIVINSSFVPQVNIQFVDIRGLAFFNQKDSPYRVLFDFPPPTFNLTVKGYYGKSLTYQLHLVKYTSEFQAENGNFVIDAQFVAMTFAPLSDILLRYVVNIAMMRNTTSMNPETNIAPKNTYELILKLKNLYSAVSDKLKTDTESLKLDTVNTEIENINVAIKALQAYNENEILNNKGKPLLIIKSKPLDIYPMKSSNSDIIRIINSLSEYDATIKNQNLTGTENTIKDRLWIVCEVGSEDKPPTTPTMTPSPVPIPTPIPLAQTLSFYTVSGKDLDTKANFNNYRTILVKNTTPLIANETDIPNAESFFNNYNLTSKIENKTQYIGIDITNYYYKLYKKKAILEKQQVELQDSLSIKINNMVSQRLGMSPSIYNIFKIILDDVDKFFDILRKTAWDAETEHNTRDAINIIAANDSDDVKGKLKIFAFPLLIASKPVFGGNKEERIAPIELSKKTSFPELNLVQEFIDSFPDQAALAEQYNLRDEQNDDGTHKWIPISPYDSTLGGANPASPYIGLTDDFLTQIYKIILKRFYILSQGTIADDFYNTDEKNTVHKAYVNLYAESEAVNLASALVATKNDMRVKEEIKPFLAQGVNVFYNKIQNITDTYANGTIDLYNFHTDDPKYFSITPIEANTNLNDNQTGLVYVNKGNPAFEGVNLYLPTIEIQTMPTDNKSSKPIDRFNSEVKLKFWDSIFEGNPIESFYEFTMENVIYIKDIKDNNSIYNDTSLKSRYLTNTNYKDGLFDDGFPKNQKIAYASGNNTFNVDNTRDKAKLKIGYDIANIWVDELGSLYPLDNKSNQCKDDLIYDKIIKSGSTLGALILLSNFGYTLSPFNKYPSDLNDIVFNTPAAVEVPNFLPSYIGALIDAIEGDDDNTPWENQILNFFTGTTGDGIGSIFGNMGYYVLADLHDIKNYIGVKDKEVFKTAFRTFYKNGDYLSLQQSLKLLYELVKKETTENYNNTNYPRFYNKKLAYNFYLNPLVESDLFMLSNMDGKASYYETILKYLVTRKNIINYSQITFKMSGMTTYSSGYTSLASGNTNTKIKTINDSYFTQFFRKLNDEIDKKKEEQKKKLEAQKKILGDVDIITQTYYSLKNINDKWLTGNNTKLGIGYPFNLDGKKLIDSFAFVDRAMNPIGDTIINAEILIQMLEDPNITIFTALSQLLSLNGFEFFPLQNFMKIGNNESDWETCFKISTNIDQTISSAFVCMYIGGSSNYLSVSKNNEFENDGITNLDAPGVSDFFTKPPTQNKGGEDDNQTSNNDKFPWRQVRAFRVRFGEQNQSMFTGIKIDSKEYPETNESIQILSRLAGDNKENAPIPKGQNLYNLYENRSYKATVTGLGNAMIQPTQYFQLENVPLFNGAYIILSVEHNIEANKMTTSFSGTKLLKYPIPRVTSSASIAGFKFGSSSGGEIVKAVLLSDDKRTEHNSMYELKIE